MPLLSVLWGFALLSLIAISLLATSGTSRNVARNALEATRMGAVAEAALVRTAMGCLIPGQTDDGLRIGVRSILNLTVCRRSSRFRTSWDVLT